MYKASRKRTEKSFHIYKKIIEFDNLILALIYKCQYKIAHAHQYQHDSEHSDMLKSVNSFALTQNKYEIEQMH